MIPQNDYAPGPGETEEEIQSRRNALPQLRGLCPSGATTCSAVSILRDIVEQFDGPGLADDQKDALAASHEWLHEHDPDPECCPKCSAGVRKLAWRREWICDSCGLIFLPNIQSTDAERSV